MIHYFWVAIETLPALILGMVIGESFSHYLFNIRSMARDDVEMEMDKWVIDRLRR